MNNPLADLKDIHVPADLGWWPPAYGWWLLAVLVIALISWLCSFLIKRHKHNLAKRQALKTLSMINSDTHNWPIELNSLLKRVVQTYQPSLAVQALYGDKWLEFLTQALPANKQAVFKPKMQHFQHALYQAQPAAQLEFAESQTLVTSWIKNARLTGGKSHKTLSQWQQQKPIQGASHV